ncbi:glutamine--fructose-6-phosphate transaminase [Motilibacter rhizosphaerae]|uniref:Glutamine--fructose-6-phosphate transaminase n=1 Tax=Motilibacter rhizosphaerae TaxID=598652 RepID=A0A4V2F4X1_9ACTN|nr:SIS domain-containing protein [Motilibacter rhizosphaerae]RZS90799.1 glutamine--fructose-6-phosphate transaminase [Motilibacter rhizosphaerae]
MSLLEQEIQEQPAAVRRFLDAAAQTELPQLVPPVWVAARGTSDNAGRYLQYLAGLRRGTAVGLATSSTIARAGRSLGYDGTVLGISQSGQSPDIVAVLADARRRGVLTVAVTNDPASPLAASADATLELHAGPERSVAATKTYTTSLAAAAVLVAAAGDDATGDRDEELLAALGAVPALMEQVLGSDEGLAAAADLLAAAPTCVVTGRGVGFATAHEVALKLTELTGSTALPLSAADLLHGPIAAVGPRTPLVVVQPAGEDLGTGEVLESALRRGAPVIALGAGDVPDGVVRVPVPQPPLPELAPFLDVLPGQRLALVVAQRRGVDVDQPFALSKVTLTS